MTHILHLSNLFINLAHVQLIERSPDHSITSIMWNSGYEEMILKGEYALFLIAILEQIAIDASHSSIVNGLNSDRSIEDLLNSERKSDGES